MTVTVDDALLDDPAALAARDPGEMLRAVASAPAQLRAAALRAAEVDLAGLDDSGRPRGLVVAGMGGSGIAGDVLSAVAGPGAPVPVLTHRGYLLPGWVGPADVVAVTSCSGTTEEALSAFDEATRRGCRVVAVGATDSPLWERATAARAPRFGVPGGLAPRASLWSLVAPLLVVGDRLGVLHAPPDVLEQAADLLDVLTERYRVDRDTFVNPAKTLATELTGASPVVWGSSPLAGAAAYRCACQLAENAKTLAVYGELPEAAHNQVVGLDAGSSWPPGDGTDASAAGRATRLVL
ncbi:MAG: mannose-6-phosphate isomerase, partial [Frankia sp.]|nr:mannose-6-phosphate isomerase [Frankia sp.]